MENINLHVNRQNSTHFIFFTNCIRILIHNSNSTVVRTSLKSKLEIKCDLIHYKLLRMDKVQIAIIKWVVKMLNWWFGKNSNHVYFLKTWNYLCTYDSSKMQKNTMHLRCSSKNYHHLPMIGNSRREKFWRLTI